MGSLEDTWKVPIAWVAFLIIQTGGGFFWAASMQSRLDQIDRGGSVTAVAAAQDVRALSARVTALEMIVAQVPVNTNRLTRIEAQIDSLRAEIDRLERETEKPPPGRVP